MARREELLRAEAEGWEAFVALADAVPPDLVDLPGLNAEGWAVRDLMWHVAFWCADAARARARKLKPEGITRAMISGRSVTVIVFDVGRFTIAD